MKERLVVAISGASGMPYAVRLLEVLKAQDKYEIHTVISDGAKDILRHEMGKKAEDILEGTIYWANNDLSAPPASGTWRFHSLAVVPCSASTVCKISCGIADNLITRLGAIALKEGRNIVILPRESPLSPPVLEAMHKLSMWGVRIVIPAPPFYNHPNTIDDMVNYVTGKVLDAMNIGHDLYSPWGGLEDGNGGKEWGHEHRRKE